MEIGEETKTIIVEPIEDPFAPPAPAEPAREQPSPVKAPEPVPA